MVVGYARTSTLEQMADLNAQVRDLTEVGCDRVYSEQTSPVGPRAQLDEALRFVREGDTIVVTQLDRLARSTRHLLEMAADARHPGDDQGRPPSGIRLLSGRRLTGHDRFTPTPDAVICATLKAALGDAPTSGTG
jgi:hypothetical protein